MVNRVELAMVSHAEPFWQENSGKIKLGGIFVFALSFAAFSIILFNYSLPAQALSETKWASSLITGTCTNPTNAYGATNSTWAGDVNVNVSCTDRYAMEDTSGPLESTQTINVIARKGSQSGNPTLAINLYENGSLVQAIVGATSITSTTGQTVSGTFNASAISDASLVEIEIVVVGAGGSPSARNSAQFDSIEWAVSYNNPLTIAATGTQTAQVEQGSTANYAGGTFRLSVATGSASVTSIAISENDATFAAATYLTNATLKYDLDTTSADGYNCSDQTYAAGDLTFQAISGASFSAEKQTFTNAGVTVSTTQTFCGYLVFDLGSGAPAGDTIEFEITANADVVSSYIETGAPAAISGSTTITAPTGGTNTVAISTLGTQNSPITIPNPDQYFGGVFVIKRTSGSATSLTNVTVSNTGTTNAQFSLTNVKLIFDIDSIAPYDCASVSKDGDETQFGLTLAGFDQTQRATFTALSAPTISGTQTFCGYLIADVVDKGTLDIKFDLRTGKRSSGATSIILQLDNDPRQMRTITIFSEGGIAISE